MMNKRFATFLHESRRSVGKSPQQIASLVGLTPELYLRLESTGNLHFYDVDHAKLARALGLKKTTLIAKYKEGLPP